MLAELCQRFDMQPATAQRDRTLARRCDPAADRRATGLTTGDWSLTSAVSGGRHVLTAPLRRRDFRLLWTGMAVSLLGDGIFIVAIAWQAYTISDRPSALAYVGLATSAPQVALLLVGGAVSDRFPRRAAPVLGRRRPGLGRGRAGLSSRRSGTLTFTSCAWWGR